MEIILGEEGELGGLFDNDDDDDEYVVVVVVIWTVGWDDAVVVDKAI